jgi:hypothetical protein
VYDNANHLTAAKHFSSGGALVVNVTYKYDALGNRVERDDLVRATAARFAFDGWNPAKAGADGSASFDVWADLDSTGSSLTTQYVHGDGVDQLLARVDSGTPYWELTDKLGSVRDIADSTGTGIAQVVYDGFGNVIRRGLKQLGLDWDTPEYPPEPPAPTKSLRIEFSR